VTGILAALARPLEHPAVNVAISESCRQFFISSVVSRLLTMVEETTERIRNRKVVEEPLIAMTAALGISTAVGPSWA